MKTRFVIILAAVAIQLAVACGQSAKSATATFSGYLSDLNCGRNVDAARNKRCFSEGQSPVLILDGSGDLLMTAKGEALKKFPGAHVKTQEQETGIL